MPEFLKGAYMITTLTKHGEGWALVIDKGVLERLKIDEETPLEMTTDGESLIVTPVLDPNRRAEFRAALEKANRQYGRALKRLAE